MVSSLILPLSDPQATLETVGGKGMSLAKLTRAGLPVPQGFHVTTEVYRRFVAENGLQPRILQALQGANPLDPTAFEPVAQQISEFFAGSPIPGDIVLAISDAYAKLSDRQSSKDGQAAVAVRSSATAEDLPEASFAGQQETYLNIRGEEAVLEAVKKCWASLWTARAMAYRARQNIAPEVVELAVVVQELVFADAAGVMFTANPINGRRDELMITAAWGLGEAIVSGAVTPDTITVAMSKGGRIRRETARKLVMTVRTAAGTNEQPVPDRLIKAPVLNKAQIKELARLGMEIERLYSGPMDIEWALAGGKFAIVQARPITALPEPPLDWPIPAARVVLTRGSFAEFLPDPVSPLFATLAVPLAGKASLKMMFDFAGLDDPDSYIMTVVNGYVYIGLKMTFKVIWLMAIKSVAASKNMLSTGKERWEATRQKYLAVVQSWRERNLSELAAPDLVAGVREIFGQTTDYYTVIQAGTIPTALTSEMVFSKYYNALVKRKNDPPAATFLFGSDNQALRAEKSLFDLAMWVKGQPSLLESLQKEPANKIYQRMCEAEVGTAWSEFSKSFAAHLATYGHTIYDLDFAKAIPADEPGLLVEAVKAYLDGTASNPYERQKLALQKREQMTQAIVKRLDPLRRKGFLKQLKWAQESAPLREDSIADLGLGQPQIRRILAELGHRLVLRGAMAHPEEIYWLEAGEIDALAAALEAGETLESYSAIVEGRKANWSKMRKVVPPSVLPQKSLLSHFGPRDDQKGDTLKGMGASIGKVTGRACVLRGSEDFGRMQAGDVIVAVITTPAWTSLFSRASAIVTDIGGPLSHSSIVAREYGIPAVLGTGNATRRIRDGQMITVDGGKGIVSLY